MKTESHAIHKYFCTVVSLLQKENSVLYNTHTLNIRLLLQSTVSKDQGPLLNAVLERLLWKCSRLQLQVTLLKM